MSQHLNADLSARYLARKLPPAELLSVDVHLASCPQCRTMLERHLPRWQPAHLTYEELAACIQGTASANATAHLEGCPHCQSDLDDLRMTAQSISPATAAGWRWRAWWLIPALAAGLAAVIFIPRTEPIPDLSIPAELEQLRPKASVLLQPVPEASSFTVLSPLHTLVADTRPQFRWSTLPGAVQYEVIVSDQNFRTLASATVAATQWQPSSDLPRRVPLTWTVKALSNGRWVSAPAPPAPEARFRLLDEESSARWAELRRKHAHAPLRLAIEAANLGLRQQALEILGTLAKPSGKAQQAIQALRW